MLFTSKHRLKFKYSYLETALIIIGFLTLGYVLNPQDPVLVHYQITYIALILVIITLFHGIGNGVLAIGILASAMQYFYTPFPTVSMLNLSILVLILGEFHYFWNRKILQNSSKNIYLRTKLDELTNAFYTLKISHDQLEKNYVFKPMSLRNSIRVLKDAYANEEDYNKEFLTLLDKSFNVNKAQLHRVENGKLYAHDDKKSEHPLEEKDPMIEMALVKKSPIYVSSQEVENNSKYLAAIPAVTQNKIKGMLLIEKMPFLAFNKDSLITISVLIAYFLDELEKWDTIELIKNKNKILNAEFAFELDRLNKLFVKFEIESTILVIKTKDELLSHLIKEMVEKNLRSLDMSTTHTSLHNNVIGILFPFADDASAQGFFIRLLKLLKLEKEDERMEFSFFDVSNLDVVRRYAEITHDDD